MNNEKKYQDLSKDDLITMLLIAQKRNKLLNEERNDIIDLYVNSRNTLAKALWLIRDIDKRIGDL